MNYDTLLLKILTSKNNRFDGYKIKRLSDYHNIMYYLNTRFDDKSDSINEILNRIKYKIEHRPVCVICGKRVKWYKSNIYSKCCCKTCSKILNTRHIKLTCLSKYGVDNAAKTELIKQKQHNIYYAHKDEIINKVKTTVFNKYGVDNVFQTNYVKNKIKQSKLEHYATTSYINIIQMKNTMYERYGTYSYINLNKIKQTKLERYGDTAYNNINKMRNTMYERYGTYSYINLEKIKQTKLERYGDSSYNNIAKQRNTLYEHYGTYSYVNVYKIKDTLYERYGTYSYINLEKIKQTNFNRYGSYWYSQTNEYKEHIRQIMQSPQFMLKRYQTQKSNGTLLSGWKSKEEDKCYKLLLSKFSYNDIFRQYVCERYPYHVDFYIKSIDTFIEYQGFNAHGGKPFENTDYDKELLNKWRKSDWCTNHKFEYIWTVSDVNKRKIAKQNNLNYFEFFNYKEFENWIKKIK